jgi:tRNA A-37 threonylcarbamoyl transferase component Bud32
MWICVIAASFAFTLGFTLYLIAFGPAELKGVVAAFENGTMVIRSVDSALPGAKSGLRAGDRVLTIDKQPIRHPQDWVAAKANCEPNRPQRWSVSRDGSLVNLEIVLPGSSVRARLSEGYIQYLCLLLGLLPLGLLILWKRPGDFAARIGSWLLLTASIAFGFPNGWAPLWRQLPLAAQALLWIPQISRFVLEGIFLSFFVVFPRPLLKRRWLWIVLWAPVLATLPWRILSFSAVIHPGQGPSVPAWILQLGFARTIIYLAAGIAVLGVSYRRLRDLNEKRRVRVLMAGTALSLMSSMVVVWIDSFKGRGMGFNLLLWIVVFPLFIGFPVSLVYAILRHRILDIQIIVRQGLRYALARRFVLALVPAVIALLMLDLAVNSQEPLARIMQRRGWIYIGLAGLALAIHVKRKQWLETIDRRFFRERYDARRVLSEVVEEIRSARSLDRVALRVVTQIESALHPEFVSLMMQEPNQPDYRALAVAPPEAPQAPSSMAAESKLIGLARVLGKPLEALVTDSAFLERRLPQSEIDMIRQRRIDLVVPIEGNPLGRQVLLLLGIKRSEEPYTRDDQELLESIASSIALLLDQPVGADIRTTQVFKECPKCGTCFDSHAEMCTQEGTHLLPVYLPRTLAGRYRLERRRGSGGMGTVYEAVDGSLERRVAVKVIRDDALGSAEAAERFQREARASAAFSHPNVVTVHDYGIDGSRAFLVMELLEGMTLRAELNRTKRLSMARLLDILRDVCAAIDAAHQRHMIHRDIKPENIFLTSSAAKVLDFGVAKFLPGHYDNASTVTAQTRPGFVVGTLAYMSPEQLLEENADVSWDLWALSVVTYEALTGVLPFPNVSTAEWRQAIFNGSFIPLDRRMPESLERQNAFFVQSFSPDRTLRSKSANEFFQRFLASQL